MRNLLTANKSSRVEFGVRVSNLPYTEIRLSPIYQDIKDINTAYFDEMESKIGEVALAYSHNKERAYFTSVDILKMRSIVKLSNKIKVITSYEQYFNAKSNNRGYNARYNCFLGYELSPNLDLHAEYNRYSDAGIKNEFYLSVSYKF